MKRATLLVLICSLTYVVGCGGSNSAEPSSSAVAGSKTPSGTDVCRLLTADEIRAVMGKDPGEPRFESNQCVWPAADGADDHLVQLMVTRTIARSYDDVARQYKEMDMDPAKAIHPIPDAGDFAVGLEGTPIVQVFVGSTMVQVSTFRHTEQQALDLAKRAAARVK